MFLSLQVDYVQLIREEVTILILLDLHWLIVLTVEDMHFVLLKHVKQLLGCLSLLVSHIADVLVLKGISVKLIPLAEILLNARIEPIEE